MLLAATMTLLMYILGYILFIELASADPEHLEDDAEGKRIIESLALLWPYHAVRVFIDVMLHGPRKD